VIRAACGEMTPRLGEEIHLQADPDRVLFFDRVTGRSLLSP
jgi:hypothetical protein